MRYNAAQGVRRWPWLLGVAAALVHAGIAGPVAWGAPTSTWRFRLESDMQLEPPSGSYVRAFVILPQGKPPEFAVLRRDAEQRLEFSIQGESFLLPRPMDMLVSRDGQTIVQQGGTPGFKDPETLKLYWLRSGGLPFSQAVGPFRHDTQFRMAADGCMAVAESLGPGTVHVLLYDTRGKVIFEKAVALPGRLVAFEALPGDAGVLLQTSDEGNPLRDHRLFVLSPAAPAPRRLPLGSARGELRILQRVVALPGGSEVLLQGKDRIAVVSTATGKLKWIRERRIRLASRFAAVRAPGDANAILLVRVQRDRKGGGGTWHLEAIDNTQQDGGEILGTGRQGLGAIRLPGTFRATGEHVFESAGSARVRLMAGHRLLSFGVEVVERSK
jgi:hypothetical protein